MQAPYHVVTVFAKPEQALGNQAAVFLEQQNPAALELLDNNDIATACFISSTESDEYTVQCFNGKNKIQCCGHGMIAAAETIFSTTNTSNIVINNNILAARVQNKFSHHLVELRLPRLTAIKQLVPSWTESLFVSNNTHLIPLQAALTKNNDGYLLLEFDSQISLADFRTMQPDLSLINKNTQRAIVAIRFDTNKQYLYMRYFAPQYGNAEDSATGSVMRFVADYIDKHYQVSEFEVIQCSAAGGFMQIKCDDKSVAITANVSMEEGL